MIGDAKAALGDRVFILGHHYQRDEVMSWADARGDSFRLSVLAQQQPEAEFIVFCGVHFMAESADVLTGRPPAGHPPRPERRLLDGRHGRHRRRSRRPGRSWQASSTSTDLVPITYMNSSAALKAFVGRARRRGVHLDQRPRRARVGVRRKGDARCCSSPTSTSAATPARHGLRPRADMRVWNPRFDLGGLSEADCKEATFLLWKGHCSVHQRFRPEHVAAFRAEHPDGIVIAHPECSHDVCALADQVGSTDFIIRAVEAAPPGSAIAVAHRDPPRAATGRRAPGQHRRVARPADLPVLDDVPHRRPAPGLGAREPGRGTGRQPDHGRRRRPPSRPASALQRMLDITEQPRD